MLTALASLALRAAIIDRIPPDYMPETVAWLREVGLVDSDGRPTAAGKAAWRAEADRLYIDAIRRNVAWSVRAEALAALGKLIDGTPLTTDDYHAIRPHEGTLAERDRETFVLSVTKLGRLVHQLRHRIDPLTSE